MADPQRFSSRKIDVLVCPIPGPPPHGVATVTGPYAPTVELKLGVQLRVLDATACASGAPGVLGEGVALVLAEGLPASGMGHLGAHGGTILTGDPLVLLGGKSVKLFVRDPSDTDFLNRLRQSLSRLFDGPTGAKWLQRMADSGKFVRYNRTTDENGYSQPTDGNAASDGTGSDSDVYWNPDHTDDTGSADPVLGHEMVHSMHAAEGDDRNGPDDHFPGQTGTSSRNEERSTVGTGGPVRQPDGSYEKNAPDYSHDSPTENSWRDDMGYQRRGSYYPKNWPGGAPW